MRDKFTEWLIHSRHVAGLTQEEAAERIGIARRTLAGYEAGSTPDDDVVACIVQVYDDYKLGYAYLVERTMTGRLILPDIQTVGVASGAITLHIQLGKMCRAYEKLETICADDIISREELPSYCRCMNELDNLIAAAVGMKITDIRPQKKSPTAKPRGSKPRKV